MAEQGWSPFEELFSVTEAIGEEQQTTLLQRLKRERLVKLVNKREYVFHEFHRSSERYLGIQDIKTDTVVVIYSHETTAAIITTFAAAQHDFIMVTAGTGMNSIPELEIDEQQWAEHVRRAVSEHAESFPKWRVYANCVRTLDDCRAVNVLREIFEGMKACGCERFRLAQRDMTPSPAKHNPAHGEFVWTHERHWSWYAVHGEDMLGPVHAVPGYVAYFGYPEMWLSLETYRKALEKEVYKAMAKHRDLFEVLTRRLMVDLQQLRNMSKEAAIAQLCSRDINRALRGGQVQDGDFGQLSCRAGDAYERLMGWSLSKQRARFLRLIKEAGNAPPLLRAARKPRPSRSAPRPQVLLPLLPRIPVNNIEVLHDESNRR